jgi:hypothetical protein
MRDIIAIIIMFLDFIPISPFVKPSQIGKLLNLMSIITVKAAILPPF